MNTKEGPSRTLLAYDAYPDLELNLAMTSVRAEEQHVPSSYFAPTVGVLVLMSVSVTLASCWTPTRVAQGAPKRSNQ